MKKFISIVLTIVLAVTLLASCKGKDPQGYYPGTPTKDSITVNIGGEPPTMFNILSIDSYSNTVLSHVLDMLVIKDPTGAIVPNAAESWEYDEDTLTYTFHIREGQVWSNGDPVTAHDFEFAWKSLLNPEFAATYAYSAFILKNGEAYTNGEVTADEVGVTALDDYTLEVILSRPVPYFLDEISGPLYGPLNQSAYEAIVAEFGEGSYGTDPDKVVTNGPYTITEWSHEDYLLVEKMEGYNGVFQVAIPKIYFDMISDANTALNAFRAGELDYIHELSGEQAISLIAEGAPVMGYQSTTIQYIDYNYDWAGLDNVNIRMGLTLSLDTQALCENVLMDGSQPAYNIVTGSITELSTGEPFTNRVGPLFEYNPELALELFEKGLEEEGLTREDLNFVIICDDKDDVKKACAFIIEQWNTVLGIEVTIEAMPFKSRIQHLIDQDFCMCFDGWTTGNNDPIDIMEVFISTNGNNAAKYLNEEYDALMALAAMEADEEARYELLAQAETLLVGEDMGPGPLYFPFRNVIVSEKVNGLVRTGFQYTWRFASIDESVVS